MATPISANAVLDLIKHRRTNYTLSKELTISKERILEIVNEAVLHVPSSFNSQSTRVIVLFDEHHDKLWDIATETLKAIVPEAAWGYTSGKLTGFKAGAATILFFEDQDVVKEFQSNYPTYHDKFPIWATQSDAMLQYALWTAFAAEGLGSNLQHYDPLIDAKVAAEWKVPASWKLNAQLVFGKPTQPAAEKTFQPLESRVKVFGN